VLEGLLGGDSSRGLIFQHFPEQVEPLVIDLIMMNELSQVYHLVIGPGDSTPPGVLGDTGKALLCRFAHDSENLLQLLYLVVALEQRCVDRKLCKNAAYRPNVNWSGILVHLKQKLWASVVESHDTFGIWLDGNGKCARKSKISQFYKLIICARQENIGRLQIAMDNSLRVAVSDSF
jgi:hypothetical protein